MFNIITVIAQSAEWDWLKALISLLSAYLPSLAQRESAKTILIKFSEYKSDFTDDSDSDAEDFWNVIRAANAAAESLPGEADDLSLTAVETPQVDGADNEEVNDSDDESEGVPEDHPLVTSIAVDSESVSLQREADDLGLDAVEALQCERVEYINARSYDPDETDSDEFDQSDNDDDRLRNPRYKKIK
ncbi:hypothetical protein IWW45_004566 [Coemansia sp. RSA 485]|nr:hypothetical protein IWW45_004566 [Coemansia sp. RSA 485]